MSFVNRTKNVTEKREAYSFSLDKALDTSTGQTGPLMYVPYPCVLVAANYAAFGASGSPVMLITNSRFIPGAGLTVFNIGSTFTLTSFGTSGVLTSGVSLPATGSTLMRLMPNDILGYYISGATVAVTGLQGQFVMTAIQDVKSYLGGLI